MRGDESLPFGRPPRMSPLVGDDGLFLFKRGQTEAEAKVLAEWEAREAYKERKRAERQIVSELTTEEESLRKIKYVRGSDLLVKPTYWLWRDRFPLGGLCLLAGKGEVSKSTVFAQFAAWLTRGEMKGQFHGTPVNVAYVVNEDLLEETVVPRMMVHGADLFRVHFLRVSTPVGEDALLFPRDSELLKDFIREHHIRATFIDPLSANVTGDGNSAREMRATYTEVSRIAQDTASSILGLAHTRKAGAADVVEAIIGSVEQSNIARSVHGLVMDPDEDGARLLSCEKLNLADRTKLATLRFRLESTDVACTDGSDLVNPQPRIVWLEEITETASDVLGDALYGTNGTDECARFIVDYLMSNGGEAAYRDIRAAAPKGSQWSDRMFDRARRKTKVKTKRVREAHAGSLWYLDYATPPRLTRESGETVISTGHSLTHTRHDAQMDEPTQDITQDITQDTL